MNVVPLHPEPEKFDLPARIRALADEIERGDHGEVDVMFCILETDERIDTIALGDVGDDIRTIGLLDAAKAVVTQSVV